MINWSSLDAVVFDIGGVFSLPHHEPVASWFTTHGVAVSADPEDYRRAHYAGVAALAGGASPSTDESDPATWLPYDWAYLATIGVADRDAAAGQELFRELFATTTETIWRWVQEHNRAAFWRLADSGMPLAIVSNNDGSAEAQLAALEICQVGHGPLRPVAAVVDSTVAGVRKPDPRIFTPALVALGVPASRALYVGDTVHADVIGARAAGMAVVQLDPYDLHGRFDHDRLPDVAAVVAKILRES